MKTLYSTFGAVLVLTLSAASPALAHTDLIKSIPAADATVAAPKALTLTFSEKVVPAFSGFDLVMGDSMKVALTMTTSADGKVVTLTPQGPLMSGGYKLSWHAASAGDGHRTDGVVAFKVK